MSWKSHSASNYPRWPGTEVGEAGSQDVGLSGLKLVKSCTHRDKLVTLENCLVPPVRGPWFLVPIFLPALQISLWIKSFLISLYPCMKEKRNILET